MIRSTRWGLLLSCICFSWNHAAADDSQPLVQQIAGSMQAALRLEPAACFALSGARIESVKKASDYFYVTVQSTELDNPPAVLGDYELTAEHELLFVPRYPLSRFVTYQFNVGPKLQAQLNTTTAASLLFRLPPPPPQPKTTVAAVYPSANELPENLLKFYIHFSAPMRRGEAYENIHLYQGEVLVEDPFLELGEELWNTEQTRFTLFIDPGRIKRGLRPREEQGPAIAAGKKYTLHIDSAWTDANHNPLAASFEKKFSVTVPDNEKLDPQNWKIETPPPGTQQAVALGFDEPLDHAMLSRVLTVKHNDGTVIEGTAEVLAEETKWQFTPNQPWSIGTYNIEIETNLEDLCGNSIARPFEVNMQQQAAAIPPALIAIEFIVK